MRFFWSGVLLATMCLTGVVPAAAQQQRVTGAPVYVPPAIAIPAWAWSGVAFTDDFVGGYAGGVAAINGNLSSNGMVVRAEGLYGSYDYDLIAPGASPNFDVLMYNAGAYAGWRFGTGIGWLTGYFGVWGEDHNNDLDPKAKLRGTETGAKGIVDLWQPLGPNWTLVGYGSYADAWNTWNAYGRLTYSITDKIKIGPETGFFGNDAYEDGKVGGYFSYSPDFLGYGEIVAAVGYRHPFTDSPDGYYANIFVDFPIR